MRAMEREWVRVKEGRDSSLAPGFPPRGESLAEAVARRRASRALASSVDGDRGKRIEERHACASHDLRLASVAAATNKQEGLSKKAKTNIPKEACESAGQALKRNLDCFAKEKGDGSIRSLFRLGEVSGR